MSELPTAPATPQAEATSGSVDVHQIFVGPMGNCVYVLVDKASSEAFLIDPAWDPVGLIDLIEGRGWQLAGILLTHTHPDHIGGEIFGHSIPGLRELDQDARGRVLLVWVHTSEAERVTAVAGIPPERLELVEEGSRIQLGETSIEVLHTPGHSPGSVCFLADGHLIAGDTIFVQGCGRVDLPGSDIDAMYHSLRRLAALPGDTRIYPGHNYGPAPTSTIEAELKQNMYLRVPSLENWRFLMQGM